MRLKVLRQAFVLVYIPTNETQKGECKERHRYGGRQIRAIATTAAKSYSALQLY